MVKLAYNEDDDKYYVSRSSLLNAADTRELYSIAALPLIFVLSPLKLLPFAMEQQPGTFGFLSACRAAELSAQNL